MSQHGPGTSILAIIINNNSYYFKAQDSVVAVSTAWRLTASVQIPALPFTHCVGLGKSLNSLCLSFTIYRMGIIIYLPPEDDVRNNELIHAKCDWNQDGRVEGHALTPSCENTRITASCWTIINRRTLELTKKDTPHPKTKEKPQ